MTFERATVSGGAIAEPKQLPQKFLLKIRRGTVFTYWTASGEVANRDDAEDIGDHRAAHVQSQMVLRESGVDGTEVEMVSV